MLVYFLGLTSLLACLTIETGLVRLSKSHEILHRDINVDNVVYHQKNDTVCGILGDPDLAAPIIPVARSHFKHMGTPLFMAMGLVEEELHYLRHDIESFVWVLVWVCTTQYSKKGRADGSPSERADTPMTDRVMMNKSEFLLMKIEKYMTPAFSFARRIVMFCMMLLRGYTQRTWFIVDLGTESPFREMSGLPPSVRPFDHETLNFAMTSKCFLKAMYYD